MFSPSAPGHKFSLSIYSGTLLLGEVSADLFRDDLLNAGYGDGHVAFRYEPPAVLPRILLRDIRIRLAYSNAYLLPDEASRIELDLGDSAAAINDDHLFGSLWIDRKDWLDRLAAKHRGGELTDEQCIQIFRFVRDGYLIIPGAVSSREVKALNLAIENAWKTPPEGLLVETFEPDSKMHYVPPDIRYRSGRTKMLDLFAYSPEVRKATSAKPVVSFLSAIFEDVPKAFQGLTFWNGSQQAIHKDTAYVKVDTNPMALAATWLALEDVKPGTGELEYFVGSHRAPDYLFGGVSKWMESYTDEHEAFLRSLYDDAEKYGFPKSTFLAKAGDVLVWHADLAHGGSMIAPDAGSRRSLVTHFTPARDIPFYRRNSQYRELDENGVVFVSQYGDVG